MGRFSVIWLKEQVRHVRQRTPGLERKPVMWCSPLQHTPDTDYPLLPVQQLHRSSHHSAETWKLSLILEQKGSQSSAMSHSSEHTKPSSRLTLALHFLGQDF